MTIETKYDVGDLVWIMSYNKCCQCKIKRIHCTKDYDDSDCYYILEDSDGELVSSYREEDIFPDKDSLLLSL